MERLSRDKVLMCVAFDMAQRGTCSRLHVGVVFSRDGRIISTGYNGAPAGLEHCFHPEDEPADKGCLIAEHAERNGVAFAARHGVALAGAEMHVTHAPCGPCAMSIINAGIIRVVYTIPYRIIDGIVLLRQAAIMVEQIEGVGYHG